jgi:hypothetical protein
MTTTIPTGASLTQDVVMRGTRLADQFADLKPGNRRMVPPGQLRTWAISGSVPDGHGYQQ